MVTLKTKTIKNKKYFYLVHNGVKKSKKHRVEFYLGTSIPKNIEEIKIKFLQKVYYDKWYSLLDKIKFNYSKDHKKMPVSAKKKETETFAIKFTYDTQRIEGSTLTLRETANLLENGITPSQKPLQDVKEAESHLKVFREMLDYDKDLSLQIILYWHKLLFESSKKDIAGRIRVHQVAIAGSKFMPPFPAEVYPLLRDFFKWYSKYKTKVHPVELAALVHLKFVTIHPFADGNGRLSRLVMNFVLNKFGFPLLNIEYKNRNSYYNALERSQTNKDYIIFVHWFFRRYLKEYKRYYEKQN